MDLRGLAWWMVPHLGGAVMWNPSMPTGGGVLAHTDIDPTIDIYQDAAKTTPATADGNPVGAIDNQGSDIYTVIQSTALNKPTLKLNILNGLSALLFDGADYLKGTFAGGLLAQPFMIFAVAQLSTPNDNANRNLVDGDDSTNRIYIYQRSGATPDDWSIYAGTANVSDGNSDSAWHIFSALYNGASSQLWLSGVSSAGPGNPGANGVDGITVGARNDGSAGWKGYIVRALIYPANLSNADKNQVGQYLATKYGLTWTDI